jgi:hypothetical protein
MTPLASLGFSGGPSGSGIVATGGTKTADGKYFVHTFLGSVNFVLTSNPNNEDFEVLVVGGGGTGGTYYSGVNGSGASSGAVIERQLKISVGTHLVTVGGGTGSSSIGSLVTAPGGPGFNGALQPSYNKPVFPAIGYASATNAYVSGVWIWPSLDGAVGTPFVSTISGTSVSYGGIGGSSGIYTGIGTSNYGAGGAGGTSGSGSSGNQGIVYIRYRG